MHGSQALQPPVRGHGLPDGERTPLAAAGTARFARGIPPLGIPFAVFSMVPPYQSRSFSLCAVDDYLMRAAALANDIKPPLALDRERLAVLALPPRVKLSAMRTYLNLAGYHLRHLPFLNLKRYRGTFVARGTFAPRIEPPAALASLGGYAP